MKKIPPPIAHWNIVRKNIETRYDKKVANLKGKKTFLNFSLDVRIIIEIPSREIYSLYREIIIKNDNHADRCCFRFFLATNNKKSNG